MGLIKINKMDYGKFWQYQSWQKELTQKLNEIKDLRKKIINFEKNN